MSSETSSLLESGSHITYCDSTVPRQADEDSTLYTPDEDRRTVGRSTFWQTLFNMSSAMLGIGSLAIPWAFACAGWIGGVCLLIACAGICCYTAKLVARVMRNDDTIESFPDLYKKAFGSGIVWIMSVLFVLELFVLAVILVILFSDSLHEVYPVVSSHTWKLIGSLILLPTLFLPLHRLAFPSALSIVSVILLCGVILINGFSKTSSPGSILDPANTALGPDWPRLPLAFGLLVGSFSAHPVIPSLVRDMKDPAKFDRMANLSFGIATITYLVIGSAGYLMFGSAVSDEVSRDLMRVPGYSQFLNNIMIWGIIINPLFKFALCTRPVSNLIEGSYRDYVQRRGALSDKALSLPPIELSIKPRPSLVSAALAEGALMVVSRVCLALAVIAVAIFLPSFAFLMALLGSTTACLVCVIGPICAKCATEKGWPMFDVLLICASLTMMAAGLSSVVRDLLSF